MRNRIALYSLLLLLCLVTAFSFAPDKGTVTFTFSNTVKGFPVVLNDSIYTNSFGETYSIKNLKYYISHITLTGSNNANAKENYQLIDEANESSKTFFIPINPGTYTAVVFTIGVDSLHNVSGAQTDALDPMNGMFWTWNSGYIMAKLEGTSAVSTQVNNRFEYHIGGFSGVNNTVKKITLPLTVPLVVAGGQTPHINIEADIDTWWQHPNNITIAGTPVCTTPGVLAKQIADNYCNMFRIKNISKN
jgi:hypothetical protein